MVLFQDTALETRDYNLLLWSSHVQEQTMEEDHNSWIKHIKNVSFLC